MGSHKLTTFTSTIFIGAGNWHQKERFGKAGTWCDWATLSRLHACNVFAELSIDHSDFTMLYNEALNALNSLAGVVSYNDISRNLFAMIINLTIQSNFQVDFALRECETLANQGRWQTSAYLKFVIIF